MNVEVGAEAAQFPEKEYINGIAVAVQISNYAEHLVFEVMDIFMNWCDWIVL